MTLSQSQYYSDIDNDGIQECEPLIAGRYLCDALGKRTTSALGMSLIYDRRNNSFRPTAGHSVTFNVDWAGLGGDVKYVKTRLKADKYFNLGSGWIFSARAEGGYVHPLNKLASGVDEVRLTDRFFLGEPEMRGFDIRGVGPRVIRYGVDASNPTAPIINFDRANSYDDALGGKAYYLGRLELEIPLGNGVREMGIRPSIFVDAGANFGVKDPELTTLAGTFTDTADGKVKTLCVLTAGGTAFASQATGAAANSAFNTCPTGTSRTITPYQEAFLGDTWKPRVAVGIGVDWNSPFGPFRINFAQTLIKQDGDDTKRFSFNVGTSFR